eukprot:1178854-Prorocentrum_minimum.AAC.2
MPHLWHRMLHLPPGGARDRHKVQQGQASSRHREHSRAQREQPPKLKQIGVRPVSLVPPWQRAGGGEGGEPQRSSYLAMVGVPITTLVCNIKNLTSFYGSSCANNGKGALNTPEIHHGSLHCSKWEETSM